MTTATVERLGLKLEAGMRQLVRAEIDRRGWTICGTARTAGLSPNTVNPWVKGERHIGTRQLCRLLSVLELERLNQ